MDLRNDIGIDLGHRNLVVYVKDKGVVLKEPAIILYNKTTNKVLGVGEDARNVIGRTPGDVAVSSIVELIKTNSDFINTVLEATFKYILEKVTNTLISKVFKPNIILCVPENIDKDIRIIMERSIKKIGGKGLCFVHSTMAAAIDNNVRIKDPAGTMVVDIGAGCTKIAVISLGTIVTNAVLEIGGEQFEEKIIEYVKTRYSVIIGKRTAETVLKEIGTLNPLEANNSIEIKGRKLSTGIPETITISPRRIFIPLAEVALKIITGVNLVLEKVPPELASDIIDRGILLTGGPSLLNGFDKILYNKSGISTRYADKPLESVACGLGKILENFKEFQKVTFTAHQFVNVDTQTVNEEIDKRQERVTINDINIDDTAKDRKEGAAITMAINQYRLKPESKIKVNNSINTVEGFADKYAEGNIKTAIGAIELLIKRGSAIILNDSEKDENLQPITYQKKLDEKKTFKKDDNHKSLSNEKQDNKSYKDFNVNDGFVFVDVNVNYKFRHIIKLGDVFELRRSKTDHEVIEIVFQDDVVDSFLAYRLDTLKSLGLSELVCSLY